MKFDVVLGNPPYNTASTSDKVKAGTSGNTSLYRKFIDRAFALRTAEGTVILVVQRAGIKYALDKFTVSSMQLDTSAHWRFSAGIFCSQGSDNSQQDLTADPIIRKTYDLSEPRQFHNAQGGSFARHSELDKYADTAVEGSSWGLVNLPSGTRPAQYAYIRGCCVASGPKIVFKGLESRNSYTITDLPHHVGGSCVLRFNSLGEAEAALKFIKTNPLMQYLKRQLREKTLGHVFRYVKSFDLSQIVSGEEYPREFGLTPEEIDYIERTI